jgi:ATPase subunit of ABC transporter with duplicated ATPase domains
MVYKVVIKDNKRSPLYYLPNLDTFKNGTEYIFKPGVNVIVGENGCGKTTLMKLIEAYLMVDKEECDKGIYNSNISRLFDKGKWDEEAVFLDGISVIADYEKNTFRLCHVADKDNDQVMKGFRNFGTFFEQRHASTGEGVHMALSSLFNMIFSSEARLTYDYSQFQKDYPQYVEYIATRKNTSIDEWTILMDEPDRNLDIENIDEIKDILSYHKPQTQIIAVVHNPLLIYSLSNNHEVNVIEMTKGYVKKVKTAVDNLLK